MAFNDCYRLSAHAVILNSEGKILLVKATYGELRWGLPGGCIDPGETVHEALERECLEELGVKVDVLYMSGMYLHQTFDSHACIFRCEMPEDAKIVLSKEHSEYGYFAIDELSEVQRYRVRECLEFDGKVCSARF